MQAHVKQHNGTLTLFHNRVLARDTAAFDTTLPPASTALYYTGPVAALATLPTDFVELDTALRLSGR